MATVHSQLMSRLMALEIAHLEWCAATDEFHNHLRKLRRSGSTTFVELDELQKNLDTKYEHYLETARLVIHAK